jgi:hypoxanthine phosphoribosyltransferase
MAVRFAHPIERDLAAIFDELQIPWEYEPRTFVLERDADGGVLEAFTPDFYLPDQDVYLECTTMRQRLTSRKNRKIRKLREQGVLVTVLYRRDFERLRDRHGFPFDLAGQSSTLG